MRDIKESAIIGGKTKRIYNIGPADTLRENRAYPYNARTPWSSSNAYARVAGITKTSCTVTKCKITSHKTIRADDAHEVTLVLQKRWEDKDGNIHALRVGIAMTHIEKPTTGWVKNFRVPVIYGDARKNPAYKDYMKLGPKGLNYYAKNSKGKVVEIQEEGWASPDDTPTHAMLMFTASTYEAFVGTIGNTLWLDNVALEY